MIRLAFKFNSTTRRTHALCGEQMMLEQHSKPHRLFTWCGASIQPRPFTKRLIHETQVCKTPLGVITIHACVVVSNKHRLHTTYPVTIQGFEICELSASNPVFDKLTAFANAGLATNSKRTHQSPCCLLMHMFSETDCAMFPLRNKD